MRLVCGIDESPAALAAACVGAAIARRLDGELTLVHAASPPRTTARDRMAQPSAGPFAERVSLAIETHGRIADSLASLTGARVALRVHAGHPVAVIDEVVRELACDLLLLGLAQRHPLLELLAASVARRLATAPPCPVALVPADASSELPRQIVAGCHGATASQAATAVAGRLAAELGMQLSLVHCAVPGTPPEAPTGWQRYDAPRRHRRVARAAADRPLSVELVDQPGRSAVTLDRMAEDREAAWIAVGEPVHGRVRRRLRQPAGCRIAARTGLPVIVAPDP